MEHDSGGSAATVDPRGRREGRHPHPRRAGGIRRHRTRQGCRGCDLRAHRRGDRARRFRTLRQAGAELEGVGAAAQSCAASSAGTVVQAADRGSAIPAGALPDRAARRLRSLAPVQRAGGRDADPCGQTRRRVGDQRAQAVHLQRLRRRPLRGVRQHQSEGRHAAGHVEFPRATRDEGPHGRALQRDAGLPLYEQRRARVRGHARPRRSSSGRERCARPGWRLLSAG